MLTRKPGLHIYRSLAHAIITSNYSIVCLCACFAAHDGRRPQNSTCCESRHNRHLWGLDFVFCGWCGFAAVGCVVFCNGFPKGVLCEECIRHDATHKSSHKHCYRKARTQRHPPSQLRFIMRSKKPSYHMRICSVDKRNTDRMNAHSAQKNHTHFSQVQYQQRCGVSVCCWRVLT